jgi:hypothetical protein
MKTSKKEFGDFDRNEKSTFKNSQDMIRNPAIELLKLKVLNPVQFDISEILQNDFVSKMSKKLIL